jgi:hypothetical protein
MARISTSRGKGKATKVPRPVLATTRAGGRSTRNPQTPTDSSMQPETQVGTRSSRVQKDRLLF